MHRLADVLASPSARPESSFCGWRLGVYRGMVLPSRL